MIAKELAAKIATVNANSIPVIYKLCRIAKILETVNNLVNWRENNSSISPGFLIESLVVCILSGRKPLWKLQSFWAEQDLKFLFNDTVTADQLNDDAYGRALDKLSEINIENLISVICLNMLKAHELILDKAHLDTTSISVQGMYEGSSTEDFDINKGFSKDHRPDLKQFKIGVAVQKDGLPIMGQILSGNSSDKEWNPDAVVKMKSFFENQGYKDLLYVGDSATVSSYESLKQLKGIRFISRFPDNFSLVDELKGKAIKDNDWQEIGMVSGTESKKASNYKICSYINNVEDVTYRFIVVKSSALEEKKKHTLEKKLRVLQEKLQKQAHKLEERSFACEEDATRALNEFISIIKVNDYAVEGEVIKKEEITFGKKGRPKKDEIGEKVTSYHAQCKILEYDPLAYKELFQKESMFVLITSILDEIQYSNEKILKEYKEQYSVEEAFRFLKSPVYLGSVYLKKKSRVEALGYVFILVLLIASYLEYRVRKSLKENNEFVPQPGNKKTDKPSIKTILEVLETVIIIIIGDERYLSSNINPVVLDMIRWVGFDTDIYFKNDYVIF